MASLTDVYEGHVRTVTTPERLYAGGGLFAVGVAMVVGSIAVATTGLGAQFGLSLYGARELAGVLAGLGFPAAVLGVFAVLPAGRTTRAAAIIGASVTVLGVALFRAAYPYRWFAAGDALAFATVVIYFLGAMTALSCLFVGLATFKTRTDPGGTARMEITEEGRIRLVEDSSLPDFGSVGLFGEGPDAEAQTQTNRESPPAGDVDSSGAEVLSNDAGPAQGPAPTADGGSATLGPADGVTDDAEFLDAAAERGRPDAYCGNCEHFEYVKVDGKITPYCGLDDDLMEDMDACEEWTEAS